MTCAWCEEEISPEEHKGTILRGADYHPECEVRIVAGSAGHQLGLCSCYRGNLEDPGGLSKRDAARAARIVFRMKQRAMEEIEELQRKATPSTWDGL